MTPFELHLLMERAPPLWIMMLIFKTLILLAIQIADKGVTVKLQDDNEKCNSGTHSDVIGVWLHR